MKHIIFLLPALCCLLCSPAAQALESYTLSMLPTQPPEKLAAMLKPLAERLSAATGNHVHPVLTKNAAEYEAELLRGGIVIGYESPMVYVNVSSQHEVLAAAVQEEDGAPLGGLIITRPETGIAALNDLQGKTIMITSKSSADGYLAQKQALKKAGFDLEQDCRLSQAAEEKGENAVLAVSLGDADAAFVSDAAWQNAQQFIRPGSVIVIMKTAPLANWAVSVSRDMPQTRKEDIRTILIQLPKDDAALQALGVTAFKAAADADYDIIRHLAENN
jgi:phosphate/phosphite/phosphonate ABC transporter binding protein